MELNESMFDIKISSNKNKLKCEIMLRDIVCDNLQYAFYLLYDNVKIDTKDYTKNNIAEFQLTFDGEYSVFGFVKYEDKKVIKTSKSIIFEVNSDYPVESKYFEKNPIPISIFGSCVSTYILEVDRRKKLNLRTSIARQLMVSAMASPIKVNFDDIYLKSRWQRSMVYNDFTKKTFEDLKSDGSKYIIIDLMNELYKILEYDGSILTSSWELEQTRFYSNNKELFEDKELNKSHPEYSYLIEDDPIQEIIRKFCDNIIKIYDESHVIIHKAYLVDEYIDKNKNIVKFCETELEFNPFFNMRMQYFYNSLEANMPNAAVIDICNGVYADENHKWGLGTMHYEKKYYVKALAEIEKIMKERK